jgi:hypothetical protein
MSLVQAFKKLHLCSTTVFGIYPYLVYGRVVPYMDAPSLAAFQLANKQGFNMAARRASLMRDRMRRHCAKNTAYNTLVEFAWDACFRVDFKWRLHAAWLAGLHIDEVLFYNHFQQKNSRAIDAAPSNTLLWHFLWSYGARPRHPHSTFGVYRPGC